MEVTIPDGSGVSARTGVSIRRAALADRDVVLLGGLRATSALRTVVDLACTLSFEEAVVAADMALHKRLIQIEQLRAYMEAHSMRKGVKRLRQVIDLAEPAAESAMETRLRLLLVLAGLPRPKAQVTLVDVSGRFVGRPDLYYPTARLALEYDGAIHRDSLVEDNRRQNALINAGYRLLRFTASDVHRHPDSVVAQVRAALSAVPSA